MGGKQPPHIQETLHPVLQGMVPALSSGLAWARGSFAICWFFFSNRGAANVSPVVNRQHPMPPRLEIILLCPWGRNRSTLCCLNRRGDYRWRVTAHDVLLAQSHLRHGNRWGASTSFLCVAERGGRGKDCIWGGRRRWFCDRAAAAGLRRKRERCLQRCAGDIQAMLH